MRARARVCLCFNYCPSQQTADDVGRVPSPRILPALSSPPTEAAADTYSPPSPSRFFKASSRSNFISGFGGGDAGGGEGDTKASKNVLKKGGSWFGRRGNRGDGERHGGGDVVGGDCGDVSSPEEVVTDELREVMRPFSANALYVFHKALPARESHERLQSTSRQPATDTSTTRTGNGGVRSREGGGTDGGRSGFGLKRVNRTPVNRLRLDVPELSSDLDSSQVRTGLERTLLKSVMRLWVMERRSLS